MSTQPGSDEQSANERIGMRIEQVLVGPPHEGEVGQGLVFRTSRGDVPSILHSAPDSTLGVIWVCGAGGGFGGPAKGVYSRLYDINYGLSHNGASVAADGEAVPLPADND